MNPFTPISYDTNDLQANGYSVSSIEHEQLPTKEAIVYALSHANRSVIPYTDYSGKTIKLMGTIRGTSVADCDAKLDIFRGYFAGEGKNLDIGYAGSTRRYACTLIDSDIPRPGGLAFANYTITLLALNAFGTPTSASTVISATGRTTATTAYGLNLGGTAPYQVLVASYTFSSVSASGSQSVSFGNNATGQQVMVTRTGWANGDVLVFDGVNFKATVNGVEVDYSGAFPEITPNVAVTMAYADTFASRSVNDLISHTPRYL